MKVARVGLVRLDACGYYVRPDGIWAYGGSAPPERVAGVTFAHDAERFAYFVDAEGDIAARSRGPAGAYEILVRLGLAPDPRYMFFIDEAGDVRAIRRRSASGTPGDAALVFRSGLALDRSRFSYFLDEDGDICVRPRPVTS